MQSIPMETPVLPQLLDSEMVIYDVPEDEYYEVFPLPTTYQETGDLCYEVYPISDICKMGLNHNLIKGGFDIWFSGLRFVSLGLPHIRHVLSKSSFFEQGRFDADIRAKWDPHMALVGSTREGT